MPGVRSGCGSGRALFQATQQVFFFEFRADHEFRITWLGHELAEPGQQHALVAHVLGQQALEAIKGVVLDLVRVADRLRVSVGVAIFVRQVLAEEVGEVVSTSAALGARKPTE